MPTHFQISVTITPNNIDLLSGIFFDLGAQAVTMTDAQNEPLFQVTPEDEPHWQHTTLHALFDADITPDPLIEHIKNNYDAFHTHDFYVEKIFNENWVLKTQKQFQVRAFSGLWVCPRWEKSSFEKTHGKKERVVFLEPGLAFGTGTHPTTQLCLTWLSEHAPKNKTVIDYGCGSGILALAALVLGAKTVWATDHDTQALSATKNNLSYNTFKNTAYCHIVTTDEIKSVRADIVVANILANPLIELAPTLMDLLLPQGTLILSGVLANDINRVTNAYLSHFNCVDTQQKDEWILMVLATHSHS